MAETRASISTMHVRSRKHSSLLPDTRHHAAPRSAGVWIDLVTLKIALGQEQVNFLSENTI